MKNKGSLRILVLYQLHLKPQSGYELMPNIGATDGNKPSPGSIYPILKELSQNGFISMSLEGKKKIYTTTKKGRQFMLSLALEQESQLKKNLQTLEKCHVHDNMQLTHIKSWPELKEKLMQLIKSQNSENKIKVIEKILRDTIAKLDKLR